MYKKRVLCIYPKPEDSTSLWRGAGPIRHLARLMPEVEFAELNEDVNWATFWGFDCVFAQRPFSHAHKAAIMLAKRMGLKIWLDYDDDLFSVPVSNPAVLTYGNKDLQREIMSIIALGDVVTVSTEQLRRKYSSLNKNTVTVPNAWNSGMFPYREENKVARAKAVVWRGTRTHAEDLDCFLPQIQKLAVDHPDWKFVFVGGAYWKVHHVIPENQLTIIEPLEQTVFYETLYRLGAKIMMVPLASHEFNLAKSSIAWQEGSFCGSTVVCPDWEEWRMPGAVNYKSPEDFLTKMENLMTPGTDLMAGAKQAWDFISKHHNLNTLNLLRLGILTKLLEIK